MTFRTFFFHALEKLDEDSDMAEPLTICHDGNVMPLMGFFNKSKQEKKVRLSPWVALAFGVR